MTCRAACPAHPRPRAGQGVSFTAEGLEDEVRPIPTERFAAWQAGRLIFDNRPLGAVAREVGRYVDEDVRVLTEALQREPVSGVFSARDAGEFFNAVQQMLLWFVCLWTGAVRPDSHRHLLARQTVGEGCQWPPPLAGYDGGDLGDIARSRCDSPGRVPRGPGALRPDGGRGEATADARTRR